MLELKNRRVTVIGLGRRTGVAAARMLAGSGARVTASDIKGAAELEEEVALLADYNIEYELGGHGEKSLQSDLIVVSPGVPLDLPFFREAEKRGIPIISEIELAYQFTAARIIGITGTNGKTTTTALIGGILKRAEVGPVRIGGNIGTPLIQEGVGLGPEGWLVVELSSFQLETIREFRPHISLYLNFTPDHLDRHKTLEAYREAKKRIFLNQRPGDYALINLDDPVVVSAVQDCPARVYHVSTRERVGEGVYLNRGELILNLPEKGYQQVPVIKTSEIPLRGKHNQQNAAFAVLAAVLAGAGLEAVREGIINFSPERHRLEEVKTARDNVPEKDRTELKDKDATELKDKDATELKDKDGTELKDIGAEDLEDCVIIDDSKATNPDAAVKALQSFDRPLILIAGGQDRKADFTELARVIKRRVRVLILLGETSEQLKERVLGEGFKGENIHLVEGMGEAVKTAFRFLERGDCLLLSPGCPSWDMYSSYHERGEDFQQAVRRELAEPQEKI